MQTTTHEYQQNARRVFTAVRTVVEDCGYLRHVRCDNDRFVIKASHGMSLIPLGEDVHIKVVATSTTSSKVVIESKNKIFFNILNIGANKRNVVTLDDYIANEVYKLLDIAGQDGREIRIVKPDIKLRGR